MTNEGTTGEASVPTKASEHLRDELNEMLDEIAKGSDRAASVKKSFEALWRQLPESGEPSAH